MHICINESHFIYLGKLKPHASAGKELVNGAKVFLKVFVEVAPKLASALGIFSAAMGVLEVFTKPSQSDLLKSVNKGLKQLTEDVNNRLKKMEGYVDGRVIELEKRLMSNEYKTLHRYWTDCAQQSNEENSIDCQRHSNRLMFAHLPHFQILAEIFYSRSEASPSYYDVKRLEAGLIPFREYAALHVYTLQVLVSLFKYISSFFYTSKIRGFESLTRIFS